MRGEAQRRVGPAGAGCAVQPKPADPPRRHAALPGAPFRGASSGPCTLSRMLELVATGDCTSETLVSFDEGPFAPLRAGSSSRVFRRGRPGGLRTSLGLRAGERWPIHVGTLAAASVRFARARRTGLLCARSESVQVRAYFVDGEPVFVTSTLSEELFGRRVVDGRSGRRRPCSSGRCFTGWNAGQRIGEALVTAGLLEPRAVQMLLAGQRLDATDHALPDAPRRAPVRRGGAERRASSAAGAPFKLLARAVRDGYDDATLESAVRRRGQHDAVCRAARLGMRCGARSAAAGSLRAAARRSR